MLHAKVALRELVPGEYSCWVSAGRLGGCAEPFLLDGVDRYLLALSQKYCMLRGHSLSRTMNHAPYRMEILAVGFHRGVFPPLFQVQAIQQALSALLY